jgi:hypothetical protein
MNNYIRKRICLINKLLEINSYIINNTYSNTIDSVIAILMELKEDYYIEQSKEYDIFMIILNKITDIIFDSEEYLKYSLIPEDANYHIINDIIYKLNQSIFIINVYLDELNHSNNKLIDLDDIMTRLNLD